MIGDTWRSIGVPSDEDLFPGRQRKDKRRLGPVDMNPVDQPVNQCGCAIGDALSTHCPLRDRAGRRQRGCAEVCSGIRLSAMMPTRKRDVVMVPMVDSGRGGNATTRCLSGDATMNLSTRTTRFGQPRQWPSHSSGVRRCQSPGICGLSTCDLGDAFPDVT